MIWNKQLNYSLKTDFNIDKQAHIMLFLMAKNNVLNEYILSLVKKDMENTNNELLNLDLCNQIMLQEMGYVIDNENNNYLIKLKGDIVELEKNKIQRTKGFESEDKNTIAKKYCLQDCNEDYMYNFQTQDSYASQDNLGLNLDLLKEIFLNCTIDVNSDNEIDEENDINEESLNLKENKTLNKNNFSSFLQSFKSLSKKQQFEILENFNKNGFNSIKSFNFVKNITNQQKDANEEIKSKDLNDSSNKEKQSLEDLYSKVNIAPEETKALDNLIGI